MSKSQTSRALPQPLAHQSKRSAAVVSFLSAGRSLPRSLLPFLLLHISSTNRQLMQPDRQLSTSLPMSSLSRSQSVRLSVCLFAIISPTLPLLMSLITIQETLQQRVQEQTPNTSEVDQWARTGYHWLSFTHTQAHIHTLHVCREHRFIHSPVASRSPHHLLLQPLKMGAWKVVITSFCSCLIAGSPRFPPLSLFFCS